jgi:hypothetical protein
MRVFAVVSEVYAKDGVKRRMSRDLLFLAGDDLEFTASMYEFIGRKMFDEFEFATVLRIASRDESVDVLS